MPPNRYSPQDAFNIDMLNPQALDTPDGLATAVRAIGAVCHRGDPKITEMIEVLNNRPFILEYIISGMLHMPLAHCHQHSPVCLLVLEEGAYAKFSKWIATGFPTSTTPNTNAIGMRLIQRFSSSLLSAKYPSTADVPTNLRASRRKVELSFDVLENLEENAKGALTGGNISPVSRKKGKAIASNRHIDPLPFDSMGIRVPTTDVEVRDVYVRVLLQLQHILEVCGFIGFISNR